MSVACVISYGKGVCCSENVEAHPLIYGEHVRLGEMAGNFLSRAAGLRGTLRSTRTRHSQFTRLSGELLSTSSTDCACTALGCQDARAVTVTTHSVSRPQPTATCSRCPSSRGKWRSPMESKPRANLEVDHTVRTSFLLVPCAGAARVGAT